MGVRIAPAGPVIRIKNKGQRTKIDDAAGCSLFFVLDNAVVVKLANTPGREPGEPQGYCAFESRQPYQRSAED
jgi:hypothetical protein